MDDEETSAPAATSVVSEALPSGGAVRGSAALPAAMSDGLEVLDEHEIQMVAEAVGGAQRAHRLHQRRVEECRKLRAALKHSQQQQQRQQRATVVTGGGFKFGDRVLFVRRHVATHSGAPRYVALREGGASAAQPYFLATASENSLLGRHLENSTANATSTAVGGTTSMASSALAALPAVALGTVVHVEQQQAPSEAAAAARLGVRPSASYCVITAEMNELNVDTLADGV